MSQSNSDESAIVPTTGVDAIITELPICSNCGIPLNGKFCHSCGQSSRSLIKFFGEVVKELVDDIFGYDSRLKHSIIPLLFKPGALSLEYIKGRRFYYVMPFRLYLITSLLFLFTVQFNFDAENIKLIDTDEQQLISDTQDRTILLNDEQKQKVLGNLTNSETLKKDDIPIVLNLPGADDTGPEDLDSKAKNKFLISFDNGKPQYEPFHLGDEGPLKEFADEINSKAPGWIDNPKPLFDELFRIAPYMMLFLIPIFALFQKLFYLFSKHFYIEHLIFSLHNHCFLYVALLVSMTIELTAEKIESSKHWFAQATFIFLEAIDVILAFWIIAYIVIATKRFYQQGWLLSLSKTIALGVIYFTLSLSGMLAMILIGAYRA